MNKKASSRAKPVSTPDPTPSPQKNENNPAPIDDLSSTCTIVGFGASAGGLEAFTEILANMPKDPGVALVLVQHLDPRHESLLTELLARTTLLQVEQIRDGVVPQPNHVYVIPANTSLVMEAGCLRLHLRPPGATQMPIDIFFRSLAQTEGSKAIGVILSGTASDGTLGLKAIKAEGGITFCQDQASAKYDGMPRSAIAAGAVDFVLSPKDIAHELVRLCRHPYVAEPPTKPEGSIREPDFSEIFAILRAATGVDFTFYKHATIRRRILRRMALNRLDAPEKYVAYIRQNRGELQSLFQDILINVTEFFREPSTFDFLKTRIFPALCNDRRTDDPIRIWVPGCSTGEEAYSVGIALLEYLSDNSIEATLQIFGTDLSEVALEKARAGVYSESIANEVSADRLRKFFAKVNGSYQISRSVRDLCIFARQNLAKDPPFSKLDLITCRNVLIYLGPVLQQRLMRLFHYALKPGGFLALGISETAGPLDLFHPVDRRHKVYARKNIPSDVALDLSASEDSPITHAQRKVPEWTGSDLHRKVDQILLSRYTPPGVVVDANLKILEFRGRTAPFLEHASGEANLNLLKMSRGGLGMEVRKLVQRAKSKNSIVRSEALQVSHNETLRSVRISVIPVHTEDSAGNEFVVLFDEIPHPEKESAKGVRAVANQVSLHRVQELEQELGSTKLYLQSVIEEQEATTEELKSANEEIQSSNEELQSTNEELLTAKEELQSTNEELTTVNEEMQGRNAELTQMNNDLSNLLSSVNIPIVMLGNDLRIRRFTPQAEKVLNLLPTDVGRLISDFRPKIDVPDLEQMFLDVIDNLAVREREVQDKEGRCYSMWIRPYRTLENKIDGAVMSLFDITERKSTAEARYRRLFEASRDGILIVDAQSFEILDANPFASNLLGHQRRELIGRNLGQSGLFTSIDLEDLSESMRDSETWQRIVSLRSRGGDAVEVEIVANAYMETERRVLQLSIRSMNGHRLDNIVPRDSRKFQIVGRVAKPLSQQFNNLVVTILGNAERLEQQAGPDAPPSAEITAIKSAAQRASELTRRLLAFGRQPGTGVKTLNLNDIIADLELVLRVMLPEAIELEVITSSDPVWFRGDSFQTGQIILELVAGARDSMPNGGALTIQCHTETIDQEFSRKHPAVPPGRYGVLHFHDTGLGADPAIRRFAASTARSPGSLSFENLQAEIRAANGYFWSYTETGKGSSATVYFPGARKDIAADNEPVPGGTETVLIVDNDHPIRELAARMLQDVGYKTREAGSGVEALKMLREHSAKIDLLLTELVMPLMSGHELAERTLALDPSTRVLYMSGSIETTIADLLAPTDSARLIRKPFTASELAKKIRSTLDNQS